MWLALHRVYGGGGQGRGQDMGSGTTHFIPMPPGMKSRQKGRLYPSHIAIPLLAADEKHPPPVGVVRIAHFCNSDRFSPD